MHSGKQPQLATEIVEPDLAPHEVQLASKAPTNRRWRRVIKLGGSLLHSPDWDRRFHQFRHADLSVMNLIVVGGGRWADVIRTLDRQLSLGDIASHWLAIGMMDVTASVVAQRMGLPIGMADSAWGHPELVVRIGSTLDDGEFRQRTARDLPVSWDVTSDSLAAWVALGTKADELVLLKSKAPEGSTPDAWARQGYVDAFFPLAARGIPRVRAVEI